MNYQQLFAVIFLLIILYSLVKSWKQLMKKIRLRKKDLGNEVETKIEEGRGMKPKIGKEIIIFYNALNPNEITIDNKWFLYLNIFSIAVELYLITYFSYFVINNKWPF